MAITNKESGDLENVNHLCMVLHILTNRVHTRMLTTDQLRSLHLAIDRLREVEAEIANGIEVVR